MSNGHKGMRKIGRLLMLVSILIFLWPDLKFKIYRENTRLMKNQWEEKYKTDKDIWERPCEALQDISEPQVETDIEREKADLSEGVIGFIDIPAMDISLPVYYGATSENLSKGAAIIEGTSMPEGGESTNCVIAGHRGYRNLPYFRDIEKLKIGDPVYLTNTRMTLTYIVEEIKIISPDDSEAIGIQEGKDLITLLTCHPYASHGRQRYLVFCRREEDAITESYIRDFTPLGIESTRTEIKGAEIRESGTETDISDSERKIVHETWIRRGCAFIVAILWIKTGMIQMESDRNRKNRIGMNGSG